MYSNNVKYVTKNSFTVLSDLSNDSMPDQPNKILPAIINTKVKSVYHQNCTVPNEDFCILHNSIGSKLQQTIFTSTIQHQSNNTSSPLPKNTSSYPSTEFFNRVSTKLKSLRLPLVQDSETEADGEKIRRRIMEKPMFITTVRSGTFLEPPPEVAALLGLRKNVSNSLNNSTTSSSEKSSGERSMMYSFASRPRIIKAHFKANTPPRNSSIGREKRSLDENTAKEMYVRLSIGNDTYVVFSASTKYDS
jgi:hypothetical protein